MSWNKWRLWVTGIDGRRKQSARVLEYVEKATITTSYSSTPVEASASKPSELVLEYVMVYECHTSIPLHHPMRKSHCNLRTMSQSYRRNAKPHERGDRPLSSRGYLRQVPRFSAPPLQTPSSRICKLLADIPPVIGQGGGSALVICLPNTGIYSSIIQRLGVDRVGSLWQMSWILGVESYSKNFYQYLVPPIQAHLAWFSLASLDRDLT